MVFSKVKKGRVSASENIIIAVGIFGDTIVVTLLDEADDSRQPRLDEAEAPKQSESGEKNY